MTTHFWYSRLPLMKIQTYQPNVMFLIETQQNLCWIFVLHQLFEETSEFTLSSPLSCCIKFFLISPSSELMLSLKSDKFTIFLFAALLTIVNLSFIYSTCDNILVESGNPSNNLRICYRVGLSKYSFFQFYSDLEDTTASFPKHLGKFATFPTFITDSLSFVNTRNLLYQPVHHRSHAFLT